jgi:uncharacterized protein (DUF1501 family)
MKNTSNTLSRRKLLHSLSSLGIAMPMALPIQAMAAAAKPALNDYKAIVCLYLQGGNDHFNTLLPYDASNYGLLQKVRPGMIPKREELVPLSPFVANGGREAAMSPHLPGMAQLFADQRLALVNQIGPLIEPVTRAGLLNGSVSRGAFPGSHNDGGSNVHALGLEGSRYGWGGKMLDLLLGQPSRTSFSSFAVGFPNVFGAGKLVHQISVDWLGFADEFPGIANQRLFGSASAPKILRSMQELRSGNLLEDAYQDNVERLFDSSAVAKSAFADSNHVPQIPGRSLDNPTAAALRTTARLIDQQYRKNRFSAPRQVFFIAMGGFDNHGGLMDAHVSQLQRLNQSLKYFQDTLDSLGLANNVVTFTTSEFGRALAGNSNKGSDHGWGGVSLVMGGPVKGRNIYGGLPDMDERSGDFDPSGGGASSIPKISIEQFGATIARWFGVADSDMETLFPLLGRFSPRYLPFL